MLTNIKAAIFDVDGTLVNSMGIWKEIDIDYLAKFGLELPDSLQYEIEGMSFKETAVYMKEKFKIPDSVEQIMEDWNDMAFDKYTNEVELKSGARELLHFLKKQGVKLGIATSNSGKLAGAVLTRHGIKDYFDCIITASEVDKGKPAPDVYLEAAKRLQILPKECLVFEDIIPGIAAGIAAGMKVCAVEDDYSKCQKEAKMELADYFIESFKEIKGIEIIDTDIFKEKGRKCL